MPATAPILHAAVVEFIHTATLVHDDIIDDAEVRRGRLAAHSQWGNDVTVLLGDFLYIKSMSLALTENSLDLVRLLCDVTLRMIEGELYQLTKNGDIDITEDEHFDIIRRKTALPVCRMRRDWRPAGHVDAGAVAGAARVRVQPRHRVPVDGRPARLHRRRRGARQAGRRRPARGQGDAAADPAARERSDRAPAGRAHRRRTDRHARAMGRGDAPAAAGRRARVRADAGPRPRAWPRGASWPSFRPVAEREALEALADYVLHRDR